ncbi:hypothetical protein [uncultured Clostridium sp.]|uniref:helix-turn-helix transcriptional regulator n=1 Tax=uncultured Clostridium sp. TaxID=59620 RepID=UPI0025EC3E9B|nr:hypothetical protein [uncultured Clostridium sp.]
MLTEQQRECIELLCIGTKTDQQIAKEIGCARETVSRWKNGNEEFKRELHKRSHLFESGLIDEAQSLLKRKLGVAVANIVEIANDKTEKAETRLKANQYLVDRVLGNTTTKIEQSGDDKSNEKKPVNIDEVLENIKKQSEKSGNN